MNKQFQQEIHFRGQIWVIEPQKNFLTFISKIKWLCKLMNFKISYENDESNKILIENENDYSKMILYNTCKNKEILVINIFGEKNKYNINQTATSPKICSKLEKFQKIENYFDNICDYDIYGDTRNGKLKTTRKSKVIKIIIIQTEKEYII